MTTIKHCIKMDKVEKIKAEIERRKSLADKQKDNTYFFARSDAYAELLNFIDSLEEESDCIYNHTIKSMKLEKGDRIFYQKDGEFYVDRVADALSTDKGVLYELVDFDWWCVTENELLDESDERVRDYMCTLKDATIKLSDVRDWLRYHARDYYESDSWSLFKDEEMIKDLCKSMLYK